MNILIKKKELPFVSTFDGYWLDIGRPDDYEKAIADYEKKLSNK
jgi:NDP-sugar pyrophosphorylase family protein